MNIYNSDTVEHSESETWAMAVSVWLVAGWIGKMYGFQMKFEGIQRQGVSKECQSDVQMADYVEMKTAGKQLPARRGRG